MQVENIAKCIHARNVKGITEGKEYGIAAATNSNYWRLKNDNGEIKCYGKSRFEIVRTDGSTPGTDPVPQVPTQPGTPAPQPPASKPAEILDPEKLSNQLEKATAFIRKEVETVTGYVAKSSCRIGHKLLEVREDKLYIGQNFSNVYEYAEKAFGLKKSSTANYIGICERFSALKNGKPTAQLKSDFTKFSYTQLSLMLSMPDEKLALISPDMTCHEIRALKSSDKAPGSGESSGKDVEGNDSDENPGSGNGSGAGKETRTVWDTLLDLTIDEDAAAQIGKIIGDVVGRRVRLQVVDVEG